MKRGSLLCVVLIIITLVLAGCGGETPTAEPRPTLEPTLPFEERIEFSSGRAENPLQMMIYPVDTVEDRLVLLLVDELEVLPSSITGEALLRDDLGLSAQLNEINDALFRDFEVAVDKWEAEDILTVDDLVRYIQVKLGDYVSESLFWRTGLYIDVILVDTYGDALSQLCQSYSGIVSMPWLDGVTLTAAVARTCGEPGLQVALAEFREPEFVALELAVFEETPEATIEPTIAPPTPEATVEGTAEATDEVSEETPSTETPPTETVTPTDAPVPTEEPTDVAEVTPEATMELTPEATPEEPIEPAEMLYVGDAGVLIFSPRLNSTSVAAIQGGVFCRLGYDDFYSWLLPSLLMAQNGIDAQHGPAQIIDYDDELAMVQAVADGDCAVTGLSQFTWDALSDQVSGVVVGQPTIAFSYGVFTYPLEVGLGVRLTLNEQLALMAEDDFDSRPLRLLLGQDAIVPVDEGDFDALEVFMESTGFDFDQIGD